MTRAIASVLAKPCIAAMGIPFEPGCKAVPEPDQDRKHDSNRGLAPFSDTRARQRVEEKERRAPADQKPKRKERCGRDNDGLLEQSEDLQGDWIKDVGVHDAIS